MNKIIVFTDGSCINNGKKYAKAGYGIYFPNNEFDNVSKSFLNQPITNQRAELYAILKTLQIIFDKDNISVDQVNIYTDSQYSMNCVTTWIKTWINNGWKSKDGKPVKNLDIIKPIHEYIKKNYGKIFFYHVKAHTENKDFNSIGNDKADVLAKNGLNQHIENKPAHLFNETNKNENKPTHLFNEIENENENNYPKLLPIDRLFDKLELSINTTNKKFNKKNMLIDYEETFEKLSIKKKKGLFLEFDDECNKNININNNKKKRTIDDFYILK